MEHHAEVVKGRMWHQWVPSWRDLAAKLLVLGILIPLGAGARQKVAPFHRTSVGDFLAGGPAILCAAHGYASRVTRLD